MCAHVSYMSALLLNYTSHIFNPYVLESVLHNNSMVILIGLRQCYNFCFRGLYILFTFTDCNLMVTLLECLLVHFLNDLGDHIHRNSHTKGSIVYMHFTYYDILYNNFFDTFFSVFCNFLHLSQHFTRLGSIMCIVAPTEVGGGAA